MRGADEVWRAEQGRFLGWFGRKNVQSCAADLATVQRLFQCLFIDQPATCTVNDADTLFGLRQIFPRQYIAGLVGQRRVQGDEICLGEQSIEVSLFNAHFNRAIGGEERVKGDNFHPQSQRAAGDNRSDIASANKAKRLARNLNAHETVFRPLTRLRLRIGLWQLTREGEHQGDGMFGRGDRIAKRRVHDDNTLGRRIRDIDIVDANARAANNLQLRSRVQYLLRHLR